MIKNLVYLAGPYSHKDKAVKEQRFHALNKQAAKMLMQGINVFSPISHSHPLTDYDLPGSWEFWQKIDRDYIECSKAMVVLMLPGWRESTGVTAEIKIAEELQIPITYVTPE